MCILSPYVDELLTLPQTLAMEVTEVMEVVCVHMFTHALSLTFLDIPQGLFLFSSTLMISTSTYSSFVKDLQMTSQ